ncbi:MAG TPA: cyclic nucleotide-binding domain-containing protein [Syntrophobacteria bacterium]|nr:cyclic nucleotide-binding domain-containing protein [Syntrophobacteria bacterium]
MLLKTISHERDTVMADVVDLLYIRDEETYSDGEVIFQQGTFGDWVYVIIEGEVKVVKKSPKGDVTVATLREGDFIGELEFLDMGKEPRSASVIAVGDVKLGVLDRDRLRREYESLSADFRLIIRTLVQRTRRITQLATSLAVT